MHHSRFLALVSLVVATLGVFLRPAYGQGIIADHTRTNLNVIPAAAITQAKQSLHIAYGHTSHGSQITEGMDGLVAFMNAKQTDAFPDGLFTFNGDGTGGALDYRDFYGNFGGVHVADDLGAPSRTAWEAATRAYLGAPDADGRGSAHTEINVIMWSWCGQVDGSYDDIQQYLTLMSGLETSYPGVRFVYMTGHLNGGGASGNVNVRNNQIRDYCRTNNKALFDFADIESYDPDGLVNYMALYADDACGYTLNGASRNWATEWQASHTEGVDWYDCGAAHSQPLNSNRKAYAAWWLWARLAGWTPVADTTAPTVPTNLHTTSVTYNHVVLAWNAASDPESGVAGYRVYRGGALLGFTLTTSYDDASVAGGASYTYTVRAVNGATLASADSAAVAATTPQPTDTEAPTAPANLAASAVTTSTVHLTWAAATDNIAVTGYRLYRDGALRSSVAGLNFDDSGLNAGTTYVYTVTARDAAGNESAVSEAATVQTADPTDTAAPSVPSGLAVGAVGTTTVQFSWAPSTDNSSVAGYRIYRDGAPVGTSATPEFGDTGLTADTGYSYAVSAFDPSNNESAPCAAVAARTLAPGQVVHTLRLEGTAAIDDAFIAADEPPTNRGGDGYVGTIDRFVIRFNLPAALTGRRVISATAHFYVWNQTNYQAGQTLALYRLTRGWSETGVTWNNAASGQPWTTPGGDRAELVGRIAHQPGTANWDHVYYPAVDLTGLVQKWAAGTVPNHGLVIDGSPVTGIGLKAAEYNPGPYLEIQYTDEAAPNLFGMWVHGRFSDAQLADPAGETTVWGREADPDGDGLPNFFEYALGTNPTDAASGLRGALSCEGLGGGLGLAFRRQARTSGVAFALEHSGDLGAWADVPAEDRTEAVVGADGGLEDVVWQVTPPAGASRGFYRLKLVPAAE